MRPEPALRPVSGFGAAVALRAVLTPRFATLTLHLSPVLFGGRAQSTGQRRYLAASLLIGCYTCALLPAAQKGKGFDVVRYRRGAGSTLAVLRFSCLPNLGVAVLAFLRGCFLPNLGVSGCWLFSGAAEKAFPLFRSHRPPSGVVPRSAEGTRRRPKRAARWGQGAPHHKGCGNCCPATRANAPPPDRETGRTSNITRGASGIRRFRASA